MAPLPITFEPHWADEWLVWVTIASVAVSTVVAVAAVWNGIQAWTIAQKSADRDSNAERTRVARSIVESIVALDRYEHSKLGISATGQRLHAQEVANATKQQAIVEIAISFEVSDPETMTNWFLNSFDSIRDIAKSAGPDSDSFRQARGLAITTIQDWSRRKVDAENLPVGSRG